MASLPKTLAGVPIKAAIAVGNVVRDPLKPVRSLRDVWTAPDDEPDEFQEMTLGEHLEELRQRLVKMCYAFVPAMLIGLFLANPLLNYMTEQANAEEGFQVLNPTGSFTVFIKIAVYIGLTIAFPLIFYQLFAFIAPGMTRKEKRYVIRSLPFVTLLFLGGVSFAVFVAVPRAFDFLSNFQSDVFKWDLVAEEVINFYLTLMLGMGLAFEIPAVMFMLARLGIVNSTKQRNFWRIAFVLILVAAAIITPTPDPVNMGIVAAPLVVLYGVGLLLAKRADAMRNKDEMKLEATAKA
jgi:sec-independent protein translocase protein TatC